MRLAFYGGTFDPIHSAHLQAALDVKRQLQLDRVLMTPCFKPVHRDRPGASAEQRLAMLQLACEPVEGLVVDSREIDRGGPSFTVDSLRSVHHDYQPEQLVCLLGVDAVNGLFRWHRWQAMLELCHLVIMSRPGEQLSPEISRLVTERQALVAADTADPNTAHSDSRHGTIRCVSVTALDISATRIRRDIGAQQAVDYLVPFPVAAYINDQGLYSAPTA